jgi:hypothetical protein
MHIVMISIVLDFSGLVLAEAVLTYIDIGVDPSMESWGNMINGARLELAQGAGGVVVIGCRIRIDVRAGAGGEYLCRCRARRLRPASA